MTPPAAVVLIVTHGEDDEHAERVIAALAERGATPLRFDTERYPERSTVTFTGGSHSTEVEIDLEDRVVRGRDVAAVLYRHRRLPVATTVVDAEARRMAEQEMLALLDGALLSLDAVWVNHPLSNQWARHKPLQLTLAAAEGFELPPTCITADPAVVRRMWREWHGRVVAKLVGGQVPEVAGEEPYAVFTTRLEAEDIRDDAAIAACPAIYQRLLDKAFDVRATVVGERVFACRIASRESDEGRVDWRRAGCAALPPAPFELDGATARRCRSLTRRLGLELAGIDLAVMPDGRAVFLEINASGQWAWIEESTEIPIAAAIADHLLERSGRLLKPSERRIAAWAHAI